MNQDHFYAWLRNIYETRESEISCTECFDLSSRFVELETSGQNAVAELPQVKHHFDQCRACREEYETLRDLVTLENQDNAPSLDDLSQLIE
ncbi:MAG TPA: hypothetical protein VGA72_16030 [Anaerolineales bacterium]